MLVRNDVLKALEEAREEKIIGKSLEAQITLVANDVQTKEVLAEIPYLHQMFIVSEATVAEEANDAKEYKFVDVAVIEHPGETCERCWVVSETVGEDETYPTICSRCVEVVIENYL